MNLSLSKQLSLFLLVTLVSFGVKAQRNVTDSIIGTPWVSVQYTGSFTSGDLADRHGYLNGLGMFAGYKTSRNWIYGFEGSYLFGNDVRANGIFSHLIDDKGTITDQNGDIAVVLVLSRGLSVNASVGKILPVLSPNPNSGLHISAGAGFLAHKYRIETQDHVVPQIELDYKKGYDRLTQGVNFSEYVGYAFMANSGFLNFYAGFYFQQGITYNMRTINFDEPDVPVSTDPMLDLQYGFRFSWLIPIYKRQPKDYYFN